MPTWAAITADDFAADGWLSNDPKLADVHPALREPDMLHGPHPFQTLRYSSGLSDSSDGSSNERSPRLGAGSLHPAELDSLARLYDTIALDGGSDKIAVTLEASNPRPVSDGKSSAKRQVRKKKSFGSDQQSRPPTSQSSNKPSETLRYSLFPMPPRTPPRGDQPFGARLDQPPPPIPQMSARRTRHFSPPSSYQSLSNREVRPANIPSSSTRTSSLGSNTNYSSPIDPPAQHHNDLEPHQLSTSHRRASDQPASALEPIVSARSSMALPPDEAPYGAPYETPYEVPEASTDAHEATGPLPSPDPHPGRCLQYGDLPMVSQWSTQSRHSSRHSNQHSSSSSEPSSSRRNSHRKTLASFTGTNKIRSMLKTSNPLIEAAKTNDLPMLLYHLAPGPSNTNPPELSPTDRNGLTPLHWASQLGHIEIVRALLTRNAHTEKHSKFQDRTPLYYAAWHDHASIVAILIEGGAAVNATSKMDGATALHKAAQQGHEDCIRVLLAAGAHVNKRDIEGMPPLMWATQGKQLRAAQMLVLAGANLEARIKLGANLELSTTQGLTVLHKAVQQGDHLFARLFLEMGADANSDSPHGLAPLHRAAGKGDYGMVQLLLEYGGNPGVRNDAGWTPLHSAARYGHRRVAHCLVGAGADPKAVTADREGVIELARRNGHVDVL
ncbi:MAG: hypothetical protein M1828_005857 [Chrysothrix sp. TS-e1954]|nr:MAG: hypothetical protein M1828_005857 [Chrysothrix sp. TS-e1954]